MKKIALLFWALTTGMLAKAQQTVYAENFESNVAYVSDAYMYSFAPSTKAGTWNGGVNLKTDGDAKINLRQGWGNGFLLKIEFKGAAVTIPNINVAGFTNLKLSYEFVVEDEGDAVVPKIEASIDGGASWVTLPTVASGAGWNRDAKSVALPSGNYKTISLRMNANTLSANAIMFDNFVITGTK
ncbi:hypothetical protein [Mucilaginibacter ginsenosidivorax]|uniref:Uncharacterized protein n=1 Tax=Mucilaginibacter ginsenosidivorax TaxID=862126 RepID=A0A5B8VY66_9SPHI|nr:hypothetical protein [Mucilaginibacter ginsenosidivorax]QEC75228.1 hypothetical protein FSB76_04470 [Mucilaginibacter ginsenosidivorax]